MPVKFLDPTSDRFANESDLISKAGQVGVLFDKPFPSEEVAALWNMMPGHWIVYWQRANGCFTVHPMGGPDVGVVACEVGHDLEAWQKVFKELTCQ